MKETTYLDLLQMESSFFRSHINDGCIKVNCIHLWRGDKGDYMALGRADIDLSPIISKLKISGDNVAFFRGIIARFGFVLRAENSEFEIYTRDAEAKTAA